MTIPVEDIRNLVYDINKRYGNEESMPCSHAWSDGVDVILWYDLPLWDSDNYCYENISFVKDKVLTEINKIQHPVLLEYLMYLEEELKHSFKGYDESLSKLEGFFEDELEALNNQCKY